MDSINKHLKTLKNNLNKFEKRIEELNLEKNNISEIKDLNDFQEEIQDMLDSIESDFDDEVYEEDSKREEIMKLTEILNESKMDFEILINKFNQKKQNMPKETNKNIELFKNSADIYSQVNEVYAKTIITQKMKNESDYPLELKIYVFKNKNYIFSSFKAKIGDLVEVESQIIKTDKAEEKYTDIISSGGAAIFVRIDPFDENKIIIHMGNIPPKEELIFTSEFIQFIEGFDSLEFELFRSLPLFVQQSDKYQTPDIKGLVEVKTKNKINKINKNILSEKLNILEEKYTNKNKNEYLIRYEYKNLSRPEWDNEKEYIPSCKIYFYNEIKKINQPRIFYQKSSKQNEINFFIQKKMNLKESKIKKTSDNLNPGLFIFLIDQSGSMDGPAMDIASKALILFLQSLPPKSYYQIIGFGSQFKKYDNEPKEYIQKHIKESIDLIKGLTANLGGTDIYSPLKNIYDSKEDYQKIKLPKNIFLLTDGEINDKNKTLQIIEQNSNEFFIYSIGIGERFDQDLIKNAGVLGKGNYNFCKNIENLNKVIISEIKNSCRPFIYDFEFKSDLYQKSLYKVMEEKPAIKLNDSISQKYILNNENNSNIFNDKINLEFNYKIINGKDTYEKYEVIPEEIQSGEELSKLIINEYLNRNKDLNEEEKTKLSLKYQILWKNTSLFAKINLSEKITKEMKTQILGGQDENAKSHKNNIALLNLLDQENHMKRLLKQKLEIPTKVGCACPVKLSKISKCALESKKEEKSISKFFGQIGSSIKGLFSKNKTSEIDDKDNNINIREIINTQDFVEGFWDINDNTKLIKEKYEKEFNLLKGLTNLKIDDKIAITILIIYYINKVHSKLLTELSLIILKAKNYIKNATQDSYENIIKRINL